MRPAVPPTLSDPKFVPCGPAATPSLAAGGAWAVVESLVEVGSIASTTAVSPEFAQRVDALYRAVRDVCQGPAAASIPDGVVGSAVLIGRFAVGWHASGGNAPKLSHSSALDPPTHTCNC